jgi:radical SAM protein with 4Fe4S-binding SPASM domain
MDESIILEQIEKADRQDLNYFEFLGTDRHDNFEDTFPSAYFDYRRAWASRMIHNDPGTFPLHVDIESTNRCNLRCSMCQIDFDSMVSGDMEMGLFKKIITECGKNRLPSLKLNYRGEPTIHKNLPEMIRIAKEAGIVEVQINSNGVALNEKLAERLIDAGLDRIKFSIDGASPEVYEQIRKVSYERVEKNVKNFVRIRNDKGKSRPGVHVQMVYMKENRSDAVQYVQIWKDVVNRIGFSVYRSALRYQDPDNISLDEHRVGPPPAATVPCSHLWQRLLITFDGTIVMCCGDQKAEMPLGNVSEISLKDAWNSHELRRYRELHLADRCNEMAICRSCEMNKTDPENARGIWKRMRSARRL